MILSKNRFAIWLAQFPIPTWGDDNFEPIASAGDKAISYVVPDTKKNYLERFVAALKSKFPLHPDWKVESSWSGVL